MTPPSPVWSPGSLPVSSAPSAIPLPMISSTIPLPIASPVATPTAPFWRRDPIIEIGTFELYRGIHQDHTQRLDAMPPTVFADIDKDVRELYTRLLFEDLLSELGSELTFLACSELRTSELDTSELKTSEYRFLKIFILASYEQELYIQCAGSDTRPPMLDRTDFASWKQRIRLYCRGKENGVNILKSIDEGPFLMGTFRETLAEGTEGALHLEDHESQLYDDFEHFRQHKGETIHDYYVWFAKLINDMRNIKMTMSRMQLNSKFVNNMLPEWGRFVTVVKLNRGLRDSNYDQLYARGSFDVIVGMDWLSKRRAPVFFVKEEEHGVHLKLELELLTEEEKFMLSKANLVTDALSRKERVKPSKLFERWYTFSKDKRNLILAAQMMRSRKRK
ncbi:hypothetical protein Tco_1182078 [Tanacetum coccineum]